MKETGATIVNEDSTKVQFAFLVGVQTAESGPERTEELLAELSELVRTLGLSITGQLTAKLRDITRACSSARARRRRSATRRCSLART